MIQAIIGAVGLGASLLGGFMGNSSSKQQAQIAQQQAMVQMQINQQQQASLALQQQVANIKYQQDLGNLKASAETVQQQQQAEETRRNLMELDARRRSREAIRDTIIARANAVATGSSKGANVFGSNADTSITGSISQIQNRGFSNVLGINQALYGGRNIFDINKNISDIWLGQNTASQGYLTQSFGLEQANRRIQATVFNLNSQQAALSAQAAQIGSSQGLAQGISSIGGALLGNSTGIGNIFQSGQGFLQGLFK